MEVREITYLAVAVRILAAVIIGGFLGLERGMKNRPAGLRTYMLVCVGSCLIMLTNQFIYQTTGAGDPMRLGAQVVSGIGFLGAGTIVVTKHNQIKGLTTAAGLWASAGVGLAFGVGFYEGALTAAIGIYSILTILQRWEKRLHKRVRTLDVYIELLAAVPLSEFIQNIRTLDFHIEDVQFEQDSTLEANTRAIVLTLKAQKREDHLILLDRIRRLEGVVHLEEL
jgi:putative Mg2+ transporter-C (MgtC) family protein